MFDTLRARKPHKHSQYRGFTLIELLVVIAIIALLAAILFPVFARARENARKSSCSNNLKQIGLGVAQYVQDYDETMPIMPYNSNAGPGLGWFLNPYTKSPQLWRCPSHTSAGALNTTNYVNPSYGYNSYFFANGATGFPARALADIRSAATVAVSFDQWDGAWFIMDHCGAAGPADRIGGNPLSVNARTRDGHLNSGNFLYADGHVKAMQSGKIQIETLECRATRNSVFYER
jgi:prepilin-type N-terminal cleavage/methylation domain-containing protein/prepilin-type processing-associated H-X9-DG protein